MAKVKVPQHQKVFLNAMALEPTPPSSPNPNPISNPPKSPPDKPPDPPIATPDHFFEVLHPENPAPNAPSNPYRGPVPAEVRAEHQKAIEEARDVIKAPFIFPLQNPLEFKGQEQGIDISSDDFNAAVELVIVTLGAGYYPTRDPTLLSTGDWASLACAVLAAIGRGYNHPYNPHSEVELALMRAEVTDPNPITPDDPTLFHRLNAIVTTLATEFRTDLINSEEDFHDWYQSIRNTFERKAARAAHIEVEETWRQWKADQIDRRAAAQEAEIAREVRNRNVDYFLKAAEEMGIQNTPKGKYVAPQHTPATGGKRTVSGSIPKAGPSTPSTPRPTRVNPSRAAKSTPSPTATPRGRPPTQTRRPAERAEDPSPTPRPRKTPPAMVGPISRPRDKEPATQPGGTQGRTSNTQPGASDLISIVQQAMAPFMARLDALERKAMPPPPLLPSRGREPNSGAARPQGSQPPPPLPGNRPGGPTVTEARPPQLAQTPTRERLGEPRVDGPKEGEFTLVSRTGKRRRGKGKANPESAHPPQPAQINVTPASYASAAAAAANKQQPPQPHKTASLPTITEVTVIRSGGHCDAQLESRIRVRAADAIVREVRLNMAKSVANPIPLKAGRWSVHPRSKGNFVYSFDGNIPFTHILSYEHLLLAPFHGSGQLCPSLGWTRLIAHGVPVMDNEEIVFGPDALLKEVRTIPALRKTFFAMSPRWLKPVGQISSSYSTITFAISDPDGSTTELLLKGRTALFGKEVTVQKWVDKPALTQCSRCHTLGHTKKSKACQWGRDSVRCHICGGAHTAEEHNQKCPRNHAVAGVCDCKHFKCLNCRGTGHHCRETTCPARDRYRPRSTRNRDKGKGRAEPQEPSDWDLWVQSLGPMDLEDEEEYVPPPSTPERRRTRSQGRTPEGSRGEPSGTAPLPMEVDNPAAVTPIDFTGQASMTYSPSRPQGSATNGPLA